MYPNQATPFSMTSHTKEGAVGEVRQVKLCSRLACAHKVQMCKCQPVTKATEQVQQQNNSKQT